MHGTLARAVLKHWAVLVSWWGKIYLVEWIPYSSQDQNPIYLHRWIYCQTPVIFSFQINMYLMDKHVQIILKYSCERYPKFISYVGHLNFKLWNWQAYFFFLQISQEKPLGFLSFWLGYPIQVQNYVKKFIPFEWHDWRNLPEEIQAVGIGERRVKGTLLWKEKALMKMKGSSCSCCFMRSFYNKMR